MIADCRRKTRLELGLRIALILSGVLSIVFDVRMCQDARAASPRDSLMAEDKDIRLRVFTENHLAGAIGLTVKIDMISLAA